MKVVLVSIGLCPTLALRNIRHYCQAHEDVRQAVDFELFDYQLPEFRDARSVSSRQWSFVTRIDEAVGEIVAAEPDVLAFSCYLWNTDLSLHLAQLVKRLRPDVLTLLGGPDAGPRAIDLLERHRHLDAVVDGDGEMPFLELLRAMLAGSPPDLARVPALRHRAGDRLAENPPPTGQVDMSLLAGVWETDKHRALDGDWFWGHLLYETLRGCPYSCSYCMYGKTPMNEKDPELCVTELADLLGRGLPVEIIDPTFTTYRKRAKRILRGLGEHDYQGRLSFEAYPDSIDEEMAGLLVAARVSQLGIGFQTVSSDGLAAVQRPENLARFERAVELLDSHGIPYYVDIIYGLPETNVADFMATIDYLYELGITSPMIYRLLGLPGSPMMADAEKHGLVFSESPPYELLSSDSYTLDEVMFCERLRAAYPETLQTLGAARTRRLAQRVGGVSEVVRRRMAGEPQADDVDAATTSSRRARTDDEGTDAQPSA